MPQSETLTLRQINRATLARQLLLTRSASRPPDAIAQLVSLQAQYAQPPFVGLWTRLEGFTRDSLHGEITAKRVVRAPAMMRHTLHLMTSDDFLRFRTAIQPAITRSFEGITKKRLSGVNLEKLLDAARARLDDGVLTTGEMLDLAEQFAPEGDHSALRYAIRSMIPLVQVPDQSQWAYSRTVSFADPECFLGLAPDREAHTSELIKRYLAAFGPASVADAQTWSALARLKPIFESLRDELVTFRNEDGKELFDLPDAPRPDSDTPAPTRFLPDYDNLVVSHADRRRVMSEEHRPRVSLKAARVRATFLLDGFVAGTWRVDKKGKHQTLVVEPFVKLKSGHRKDLAAEGERLLTFVAGDGAVGVEFEDPT